MVNIGDHQAAIETCRQQLTELKSAYETQLKQLIDTLGATGGESKQLVLRVAQVRRAVRHHNLCHT